MLRKVFLLFGFVLTSSVVFADVHPQILSQEIKERVSRVPEFDFIIKEANKMGVKVYLFGGTAAAFAHYVRWDIERENGSDRYIPERFDYDFTNIYRGNQDLDIVIDGTEAQSKIFKAILAARYPHFMGEKDAWEVRLLQKQVGDKQALLENAEFLNQHSDTNSTGLLQLNPDQDDPVLRDLKSWDEPVSDFLVDLSQGKIRYIHSDKHKKTFRYKQKLNPPILSAIRYLAKLTQYELQGTKEDMLKVTEIIEQTKLSKLSSYAEKKVEEFGLKVLLNSPNLAYASQILDETGLRKKLIEMDEENEKTQGSLAWWMSKKPLKSYPIKESVTKKTAADLFKPNANDDIIVAHETDSFVAYESIVKAPSGEVNAFISRRSNSQGETAAYGNGFYVKVGREGFRLDETGLTIRMKLDPKAVEGVDFDYVKTVDYLVVKNKSVLRVIPDDLKMGIVEFFDLLISEKIGSKDKGLIERLRRKYNRQGVSEEEMIKVEKKLAKIEWKEENQHIFHFWFASSFMRKNKELIENYMYSSHAMSDVFKGLYDKKRSSTELQRMINKEFFSMDLNKVFSELENISIYSIDTKMNMVYLLVLFNVYKGVKDNPKYVSEIDRRVAQGFSRLTGKFEKKGVLGVDISSAELEEVESFSKYLVDKVLESSHMDDDLGLMFVSKYIIRSYGHHFMKNVKDKIDIVADGLWESAFQIWLYYFILTSDSASLVLYYTSLAAVQATIILKFIKVYRKKITKTKVRSKIIEKLKEIVKSHQLKAEGVNDSDLLPSSCQSILE